MKILWNFHAYENSHIYANIIYYFTAYIKERHGKYEVVKAQKNNSIVMLKVTGENT